MSSLVELTLARLRSFTREPSVLFWTFGFPLLITTALGLAFRDGGKNHVKVAIIEDEQSAAIAKTLASDTGLALSLLPAEAAYSALRHGEVALVVEAKAGFHLAYHFDPSHPGALNTRNQVDTLLQRAAGRQDTLTVSDETFTAPGGRYIDWMIPGFVGFQLLNGAMWGIGMGMASLRQKKLLKRMAATPMSKGVFLLSWILSTLVVVPFQVGVVLLFGRFAFGVHVVGSLWTVAVATMAGSLAFTGLALFCSSRAENSETANGLINLATLPMFMLSGVFFSTANFPGWMQPVIHALPLSALNEGLRAVVNDGASFSAILPQLAVLAIWGLAGFALALRLFRWN